MKDVLVGRLIDLGKQGSFPGFEDSIESLERKFNSMPEKELLGFFELVVLQCHRDGIQ